MAIKASNQITITDITDAYSIFIDNENHTFMADKDGYVTGSVISNIKAYCGTDVVEATIGTIKFYQNGSEVTGSNLHFKATVGGTATARTVTIGLKDGETSALLTDPMEVRIPLSLDNNAVEITKTVTISAAKTGATGQGGAAGKGISSVIRYFQRTTTNSAPSRNDTGSPGSSWSTTMTAPDSAHPYLWATDHYAYTDTTSANSTVILASQYNDASAWFQGSGAPSATTVTTAAHVNDQYLDTSNGDVYKCTTAGTPGSWSKTGNIKGAPGTNGTNGTNGADAILLEISSNGPTVFKKNTDNVKLTPVVRVAGSALTITAGANGGTVSIGGTTHYVRWYNGSTELTKANTANSVVAEKSSSNYTGNLTLYGAYVTNAALIECRLDTTAAS